MTDAESRTGHPCVSANCGHAETDHVATPELASHEETVVWCAACRRHEVHRPRRIAFPWSKGERAHSRRRFSRPS